MEQTFTPSANKAVVEQYVELVWGKGDASVLDNILADRFKMMSPLVGVLTDREVLKSKVKAIHTSFPNFASSAVGPYIAEDTSVGSFVAVRYASNATHTGPPFTDVPEGMKGLTEANTGKELKLTGIAMIKLEQGKIVEIVEEENGLELLMTWGLVKPA